jgi:hypothetical protein
MREKPGAVSGAPRSDTNTNATAPSLPNFWLARWRRLFLARGVEPPTGARDGTRAAGVRARCSFLFCVLAWRCRRATGSSRPPAPRLRRGGVSLAAFRSSIILETESYQSYRFWVGFGLVTEFSRRGSHASVGQRGPGLERRISASKLGLSVLQNFRSVVDDPLPRCARPAPPPTIDASSPDRLDRSSSIVAPNPATNNSTKTNGAGAAGDLTIVPPRRCTDQAARAGLARV